MAPSWSRCTTRSPDLRGCGLVSGSRDWTPTSPARCWGQPGPAGPEPLGWALTPGQPWVTIHSTRQACRGGTAQDRTREPSQSGGVGYREVATMKDSEKHAKSLNGRTKMHATWVVVRGSCSAVVTAMTSWLYSKNYAKSLKRSSIYTRAITNHYLRPPRAVIHEVNA